MEMMIVNILQGMGIDTNDLMAKANNLITNVESKLNKFDERLARIEKALNIAEDADVKTIAESEIK